MMNQPKLDEEHNRLIDDLRPDYGIHEVGEDEFEGPMSKYIRSGFIKKVYSILCFQLLLTAASVILGLYVGSFHKFIIENMWLTYTAIGINLMTLITLYCIPTCAQSVPTNYILLLMFTISEAYMVTGVCINYNKNVVLTAALLTSAMVIALTIYAITTKTDFTILGGFLCIACFVLLVATIIGYFVKIKILQLIISVITVIIFGIYLIYDTQLLVGGNRSLQLTVDDYIIGALSLYIDIITIFLHILKIVGSTGSSN